MAEPPSTTLARYSNAVQACAVMNLRQVARSVTARFDGQLRPAGLRATQLNLLMAIETSASATITGLAEILAMDRTTMTRNLKLLRDRRLVERNRIVLTDKGSTRYVDVDVVLIIRIDDQRMRVRTAASLHRGHLLRIPDVGNIENPDTPETIFLHCRQARLWRFSGGWRRSRRKSLRAAIDATVGHLH